MADQTPKHQCQPYPAPDSYLKVHYCFKCSSALCDERKGNEPVCYKLFGKAPKAYCTRQCAELCCVECDGPCRYKGWCRHRRTDKLSRDIEYKGTVYPKGTVYRNVWICAIAGNSIDYKYTLMDKSYISERVPVILVETDSYGGDDGSNSRWLTVGTTWPDDHNQVHLVEYIRCLHPRWSFTCQATGWLWSTKTTESVRLRRAPVGRYGERDIDIPTLINNGPGFRQAFQFDDNLSSGGFSDVFSSLQFHPYVTIRDVVQSTAELFRERDSYYKYKEQLLSLATGSLLELLIPRVLIELVVQCYLDSPYSPE